MRLLFFLIFNFVTFQAVGGEPAFLRLIDVSDNRSETEWTIQFITHQSVKAGSILKVIYRADQSTEDISYEICDKRVYEGREATLKLIKYCDPESKTIITHEIPAFSPHKISFHFKAKPPNDFSTHATWWKLEIQTPDGQTTHGPSNEFRGANIWSRKRDYC
eukprot:Filipodium_phascolosomae@DN7240_c0_g1_i1.p1